MASAQGNKDDMKDGGVLQKTTMQGPQVAVSFKF
jgi:hypothetical protein